MNRQAFKQRMQNLKSYRENNPGKGYWDWKDDRTDHPIKKPTLPQEPIRIQYAIRNLGGKPDESWRKYDKDNDRQLSSEERLNRQKDERRIEDWKNLGRGISNTFGTAASLASLIGGGGWALTRLLAGNRATQLGRSLAPLVLPTNAADNVGDIIDFATEPTTSKAVEIGVGLGLGKWKDFGSTARQTAELSNQSLNVTNTFTESFADGGVNDNLIGSYSNHTGTPTIQKAYMNQLRTMLKQNGDIQNLDEPVSSTLLKKYLDKMSDSDPIKKMFKQHKNINAYTKWFNTIPLLGTTALGANAYFNNNKNE